VRESAAKLRTKPLVKSIQELDNLTGKVHLHTV